MAGALQGVPFLVFAPHRGALWGLPWGLPFFNKMGVFLLFVWGLFALFILTPPPGGPYIAYNSLAAFIDVDMFNSHLLLPLTPVFF